MNEKIKILLLEDDPLDAKLLKRQLSQVEAFEYEIAHHLKLPVALEDLKKRAFDVIITDLSVPGASGMDIFTAIQRISRKTPIIILSGTVQELEASKKFLQSGAQDMFLKRNYNGELVVRSILFGMERRKMEVLKDDFINIASHELRGPVAIIQGIIANLADGIAGTLNEKQKEMVASAKKNSARLAKLVNNLLDFSRLESGSLKMNINSHPPEKLIQEAVNEFLPLAEEKKLRLRYEVAGGMPEMKVDKDLLKQVLKNLLENALRFAKTEIAVSGEALEVEGERVCKITVANDGPSLSPKEIGQLFKKFSQVHRPSGGEDYKGTGLGLSLCRGIMEQHWGRIWAESNEGQGVRFCLSIPLTPPRYDLSVGRF